MTVTLTGYGGVGEIGGNAFLLDDGRTRILLDMGKRFGNDRAVESLGLRPGWNDYYDEFVQPRMFRLVPDLLAMDLVPGIPSLYRADLGGAPGAPPVDLVAVSHAHMDHAGLVGLLRPEVPVFASTETRATLASMQATGQSGVLNEFVTTKARGLARRKRDGALTLRSNRNPAGPDRAYLDHRRHDVGPWAVEQAAVDHSIHGARALLVEGPALNLAYTGDFRMQGRNRHATERFVERAQGVDVLVTEGTRVHRDDDREMDETDKEIDVEAEVETFVRQADGEPGATGFVAVSYPPRDLDRFVSLWNVARRLGRSLVITARQAHLIDGLRAAGRDDLPDPSSDANLAIHVRARITSPLLTDPRSPLPLADASLVPASVVAEPEDVARLVEADGGKWEVPYVNAPNAVTSAHIGAEPTGFLFTLNYWTITELGDVFPDRARAGGLYVHSQTQPFNDDMLVQDRKLKRWLSWYGLSLRNTHVSGHVDAEHLDWVLDKVGARLLVPVHSQAPGVTAERYRARTGHRAELPEPGRALTLA